MSIPTEAERLAGYHASMAATIAASGGAKSSANPISLGQGCLQTADTARHIHEMAQRKAQQVENKLTPAEIIQADAAGRALARHRAQLAGTTLTDIDLQRAGREMVQQKANTK